VDFQLEKDIFSVSGHGNKKNQLFKKYTLDVSFYIYRAQMRGGPTFHYSFSSYSNIMTNTSNIDEDVRDSV
jgi:hypothetical protein